MNREQRIKQIVEANHARITQLGNDAATSNNEIMESFAAVNGKTQGHLLHILYQHHQVHANVIRVMRQCAAPEKACEAINSMWVEATASIANRLSEISHVDPWQVRQIIITAQGMTNRLTGVVSQVEKDINDQIKKELGE